MHRIGAGGEGQVVVVGAGLGGLAAAAGLAQAGRKVVVLEKARAPGGRAVTQREGAFLFNLGPHALYRAGAGLAALRALGIEPQGGVPASRGTWAWSAGRLERLPAGPVSLLRTGLFGGAAKLEAARVLAGLPWIDVAALMGTTVRAWIEGAATSQPVRDLLFALLRVATYADEPDRQSAGAAVSQLQMVLRSNVLYLHGGWQTLVDALRTAAEAAGARIVTGARAAEVVLEGEGTRPNVRALRLWDGTEILAREVLIAGAPDVASALVRGGRDETLAGWAAAAIPVRAACLDVALSRLPDPRGVFALGIDRPLYASVHSATARLAPEGSAVIHLARYLGREGATPTDERDLEEILDALQPGWRELVVTRRFLPQMTVTHALVEAARGGYAGRPGPSVPHIDGLHVAGDWVGPEGMLADAVLASARSAVTAILARGAGTARGTTPATNGGSAAGASSTRDDSPGAIMGAPASP